MRKWTFALPAHRQWTKKGPSARCRAVAKNINKNTSAKILQREWNACRKLPKRPAVYLTQTIRTCKRATVRNQKGHSCTTTVALLQARLSPFSPIFGLKAVSIIFKRLITKLLKTPLIFAYLRPIAVRYKYRKQRGRKRINSLTIHLIRRVYCPTPFSPIHTPTTQESLTR